MASYSKQLLSESDNGKGIEIAVTSGTGDLIHTNPAGTDEVYLWATNNDSEDRALTLQWGGTASPGNEITFTIPANSGAQALTGGLLITGGLSIRAFAAVADKITVYGFCNNIN